MDRFKLSGFEAPEKDASFQAEIPSSSGDESNPSIQGTSIPDVTVVVAFLDLKICRIAGALTANPKSKAPIRRLEQRNALAKECFMHRPALCLSMNKFPTLDFPA
jgi:hypothetical protein